MFDLAYEYEVYSTWKNTLPQHLTSVSNSSHVLNTQILVSQCVCEFKQFKTMKQMWGRWFGSFIGTASYKRKYRNNCLLFFSFSLCVFGALFDIVTRIYVNSEFVKHSLFMSTFVSKCKLYTPRNNSCRSFDKREIFLIFSLHVLIER